LGEQLVEAVGSHRAVVVFLKRIGRLASVFVSRRLCPDNLVHVPHAKLVSALLELKVIYRGHVQSLKTSARSVAPRGQGRRKDGA
jgi:hypothetical protein